MIIVSFMSFYILAILGRIFTMYRNFGLCPNILIWAQTDMPGYATGRTVVRPVAVKYVGLSKAEGLTDGVGVVEL